MQSSSEIPAPSIREVDPLGPAQIGLITVNYHSAESVAKLLGDLDGLDRTGIGLHVVVADNSPGSGEVERLCRDRSGDFTVRYFPLPSNPGYLGAAHRALQHFWPHKAPEWLIVCNADLRFPQEFFLPLLCRQAEEAGAVIAPRIVSAQTGLDQNPFQRRRPSPRRMSAIRYVLRWPALYWLLGFQSRLRKRWRASRPVPRRPEHAQRIYAPHGAMMIFRRRYFERGGDLNVGSFLYAEEIYVAETCRRLGLNVEWVPMLEAVHEEHQSISRSPSVRRFQIESAEYCYRKFFAPVSQTTEGA